MDCQSAVKFRKGYTTTQCLNFSSKIFWLHLISPVLRQETRALTNLFPSLMEYASCFMMATSISWYIESIWEMADLHCIEDEVFHLGFLQ